MPLSIEHLPVEIWLMIFTFIEANDLQKVFSNLNSSSLRVTMNITMGGCKVFTGSQYSLHPRTIEAFHANLDGTCDLLIYLDSTSTLPNLRSLSLHIRRQKSSHLLLSF